MVENCKCQPVSFGDLPVQIVRRGDRELQVSDGPYGLAVSWEGDSGQVTAIGLRDMNEMDLLLAAR